jgi:hypothetical protein
MADSDFFTGTRNTPLGTPKAGISVRSTSWRPTSRREAAPTRQPFRNTSGG